MADTIAAISTPLATGGIAMIRISGEKAIEIGDKIAKGVSLKEKEGYTASFSFFQDKEGNFLDEGIVILYRNPHSFTGEDIVELCCHGGVFIARRILREVLDLGARMAEPGEFSKRAYLNGKMDLTKAEGIAKLISAKTQKAAEAAAELMEEALYKRIKGNCDNMLSMTAQIQAWIDYPDEEIPIGETEKLYQNTREIRDELSKLLKSYDQGRALHEGVTIALVGKPNVGKSTWMNRLCGREKSIVTDIAGTTRDVIEEQLELGGVPCRICDTAGICNPSHRVEEIGVQKSWENLKKADLAIVILDGSREMEGEDIKLLDAASKTPSILLVNKSDLPQKIKLNEIPKEYKNILYTSKEDEESLAKVKEAISKIIESSDLDPSIPVLANERQRDCLQRSLSELEKLEELPSIDLVGVLLESAMEPLFELTGERVQESVVDKIFSEFCVGK